MMETIEIDDPSEHQWLRFLVVSGAFDDLANPREDIYSIEDGEPFVDEQVDARLKHLFDL